MARTTKNAEVLPPMDDSRVLDLTGLETGDDLNPALQSLYAEMGQDKFGKIKVYMYKIVPETGKEPRVWEGVPDDYDLMAVAKRFGSGEYRVKVYGPHESGRIVVFANTVFPILLDPAEDARIVAQREGLPVPQQAQNPQAITPEQIAAIVAQTIKAAMPAQVDPMAQMGQLAGILKQIMPQQQVVPQGNTFAETLTAAKALLELTRGLTPPVDGEGRFDAKGMALTRGVDLLAQMFEKSIQQNAARPVGSPAQPANPALPATGEQAQGTEVQLNAEQQEQLEMLRLQIRMVNRRAAANVDPAQLVEEYYAEIPDEIFDTIVFNPQWFEILCQNVAECATHKDWYEKLRTAFIAKGIKEEDLKSMPDGSLTYTEEESTSTA